MSAVEEPGESMNVENIPVSRGKVRYCVSGIMITYCLH